MDTDQAGARESVPSLWLKVRALESYPHDCISPLRVPCSPRSSLDIIQESDEEASDTSSAPGSPFWISRNTEGCPRSAGLDVIPEETPEAGPWGSTRSEYYSHSWTTRSSEPVQVWGRPIEAVECSEAWSAVSSGDGCCSAQHVSFFSEDGERHREEPWQLLDIQQPRECGDVQSTNDAKTCPEWIRHFDVDARFPEEASFPLRALHLSLLAAIPEIDGTAVRVEARVSDLVSPGRRQLRRGLPPISESEDTQLCERVLTGLSLQPWRTGRATLETCHQQPTSKQCSLRILQHLAKGSEMALERYPHYVPRRSVQFQPSVTPVYEVEEEFLPFDSMAAGIYSRFLGRSFETKYPSDLGRHHQCCCCGLPSVLEGKEQMSAAHEQMFMDIFPRDLCFPKPILKSYNSRLHSVPEEA